MDAARPAGIRQSAEYFPELDALRGIAIALVYAFHLDLCVMGHLFSPPQTVPLALVFVRGGNTGVGLFFIISGFLLSQPFLAAAHGGRPVRLGAFTARRALRILPLYYLVVAIAAVHTAQSAADLWRGVPYFLLLQGFVPLQPLQGYSGVWWSLATEAQFYVALPFIAFAMRQRWLGALLGVAYAAAYTAFLMGGLRLAAGSQILLAISIFGYGWLFLGGALVAWLVQHRGDAWREQLAACRWLRRGGADVLLLALIAALALLLRAVLRVGLWRESPPYHGWHLAEAALWSAVLLVVIVSPLRLKRVLCSRPVVALGIISYSVYLLHVPVLALPMVTLRVRGAIPLGGWDPRTTITVVVLTGVCLAVSALTYFLIERPFLRRKAQLDV